MNMIPDVEFRATCPVCGRSLDFDADGFYCVDDRILWNSSGQEGQKTS